MATSQTRGSGPDSAIRWHELATVVGRLTAQSSGDRRYALAALQQHLQNPSGDIRRRSGPDLLQELRPEHRWKHLERSLTEPQKKVLRTVGDELAAKMADPARMRVVDHGSQVIVRTNLSGTQSLIQADGRRNVGAHGNFVTFGDGPGARATRSRRI